MTVEKLVEIYLMDVYRIEDRSRTTYGYIFNNIFSKDPFDNYKHH